MSNDTFALTTGQAHKLEMGFRRTGWDNAEVEVLCMGNNLALVKDLINGKLELQVPRFKELGYFAGALHASYFLVMAEGEINGTRWFEAVFYQVFGRLHNV